MAQTVDLTLRTRTSALSLLTTCLLARRPYRIKNHSTLNELLGIEANAVLAAGVYPQYAALIWGDGGTRNATSPQGLTVGLPVKKLPRNAGLVRQRPFVLRPLTAALTPAERSRLCLRREETIGGVVYEAYYGLTLNLDDLDPDLNELIINNGVISSTPFEYTVADLQPPLPSVPNAGVVGVDNHYNSVAADVSLMFDSWLVAEMGNVAEIIHGDASFGVISEMAVVTAVPTARTVTPSAGAPFSMTEMLHAQIAFHFTGNQSIAFGLTQQTNTLSLGNADPLFYAVASS